jgi:hypothetical protein
MHEYCPPSDAEPLHSASVAEPKRAKYTDPKLEPMNGKRHHAEGVFSTFVRTGAGMTRKGQGAKQKGDNWRDSNTNAPNPNDCGKGRY